MAANESRSPILSILPTSVTSVISVTSMIGKFLVGHQQSFSSSDLSRSSEPSGSPVPSGSSGSSGSPGSSRSPDPYVLSGLPALPAYKTPITIRTFISHAVRYTGSSRHYPIIGRDTYPVYCSICAKSNIANRIHYGYLCLDMCESCYVYHSQTPSDDYMTARGSIFFNTELKIVATTPLDALYPYELHEPASKHICDFSPVLGIIIGYPLTSSQLGWIKPGSKLTFDQMKHATQRGTFFHPALSHYPKIYGAFQQYLTDKIHHVTTFDLYLTNGFSVFCACCGSIGLECSVGYFDDSYTGLHYDICAKCCIDFCVNNKIVPNIKFTTFDELTRVPDKIIYDIPEGYTYTYRQSNTLRFVYTSRFSDPIPTWRRY